MMKNWKGKPKEDGFNTDVDLREDLKSSDPHA